jgi:hypothetical protein
MHERRALRGLPLAAVASAGVVLGHWLSYLAAVPQAHLRHTLLADSGHSYWSWIVKLAVALGFAGLGALVVRAANRRVGVPDSPIAGFAWVLWRLAPVQIAAFTVMEIAERVVSGAPLPPLFGRLYLTGIAVQFLVASVGAILLLWLARVVDQAVRWLFPRVRAPRASAPVLRPVETARVVLSPIAGAAGVRGPPSP